MNSCCNFTRPEYRGNLLCLHTGHYELHHFSFARSQAFMPVIQFGHLIPLASQLLVALQRLLNRIEEFLMAEWFRQELKGARLHGLYSHGNIPVSRDEDDWDIDPHFTQFMLEDRKSTRLNSSH